MNMLRELANKKKFTYRQRSTPGHSAFTIKLIFRHKRVTDKMLPHGTPVSCSASLE